MIPEQKEQFRKQILDDIAALKDVVAGLRDKTKPVAPDNAIGRLTRMDAINSKSMYEASLNKALEKIQLLNQTLQRIDQPGFGICSGCQQAIPVERILLVPESIKCVRCAA